MTFELRLYLRQRTTVSMINVLISALSTISFSSRRNPEISKKYMSPVSRVSSAILLRIRRTTKSRYVPRCLGVPPGDAEFFNFLSPSRSPALLVFRESRKILDSFPSSPDARARTDKSCSHLDDLWNFCASGQRSTCTTISIFTAGQFSRNLDKGVVFIPPMTTRKLNS